VSCAASGCIMRQAARCRTRGSQFSHRFASRTERVSGRNETAQGEADWINCPPRSARLRCVASHPAARPVGSSKRPFPPVDECAAGAGNRYAGWVIASHPTAQNRLVNKFGPYVAWTLEGLSSAIAGMGGFAATDATKPAKPAAKRGELVAFGSTLAHGGFARWAQLADSLESRHPDSSRAAGAAEPLWPDRGSDAVRRGTGRPLTSDGCQRSSRSPDDIDQF
jgi:hypothetical protein